MVRISLVAVLTIGLLTAADPVDPKKVAKETKAMEGTWELVSGEVGGQKLPEAFTKSLKLVLKGDKYTLKSTSPDDKGSVKLDPTAKLKTLDVIGEEGPNKGKTMLAIYQFDGDSLKVCYDLEGKLRPTEFKSAAGSKHFLAVYKRFKEEKK